MNHVEFKEITHHKYSFRVKLKRFNVDTEILAPLNEFCRDSFGDPGDRWFSWLSAFYFVHKSDALLFWMRVE